MTTYDQTPGGTADARPVLLVVDANPGARAALEAALLRRFAADYRVLTADSAEAGLASLAALGQQGEEVALVAADLHLPGMDGVEFLGRARTLHPCALRALLVAMDRRGTRIPFAALGSLQRATALGRSTSGW